MVVVVVSQPEQPVVAAQLVLVLVLAWVSVSVSVWASVVLSLHRLQQPVVRSGPFLPHVCRYMDLRGN